MLSFIWNYVCNVWNSDNEEYFQKISSLKNKYWGSVDQFISFVYKRFQTDEIPGMPLAKSKIFQSTRVITKPQYSSNDKLRSSYMIELNPDESLGSIYIDLDQLDSIEVEVGGQRFDQISDINVMEALRKLYDMNKTITTINGKTLF